MTHNTPAHLKLLTDEASTSRDARMVMGLKDDVRRDGFTTAKDKQVRRFLIGLKFVIRQVQNGLWRKE
jgi:hypothetical protein